MQNKNPFFIHGAALALCLLATAPLLAEQQEPAGFHCVITPSQTVELGTPVPGQLHEVLVDRSDSVTAGQIVASLDSRLEKAGLDIARFRAETDTEVSLREAAYAIDRRTHRRLRSLAASKVASAQDKDRAARESRLSAWRVQQAKDDLELNALELARAEAALDRRRIRSPIDGIVAARLHNPGEYVDDEPLMRIVSLDPLYIEAIVPMRLFGSIKPGMRAEVFPDLDNAGSHEASVVLVDQMGDAGSGTFGVRLSLPNPENRVPAGLKCRVELHPESAPVLSGLKEGTENSPKLAESRSTQH